MKIRTRIKEYKAEQWFHGKYIENVFEKDENSSAIIAPDKEGVYCCAAYLKSNNENFLVREGDWIVTDEKGRKNVCSDEILKDHFEEILHPIYTDLEVPSFDDFNLNAEEINKCKKMFEEISYLLRKNIGLMEIHLAWFISSKLKDEIKRSMDLNLIEVLNEKKRRAVK